MKIAVIFGWMASSRRVVSKYSALYSGFECISANMPMRVAFVPFLGRRAAVDVVRQLDSLASRQVGGSSPVDVVFHFFSGSAAAFSWGLLPAMQRADAKWRLRAMIHDSGPVQFSAKPGIAAGVLLVKQGRMWRSTAVIGEMGGHTSVFLFGKAQRANLNGFMASPHTAVPQLFLYSRSDSVVSWKDIEERIVEQNEERGLPVTSHCWEDTEHVMHYVGHREEYETLVRDFLAKHVS